MKLRSLQTCLGRLGETPPTNGSLCSENSKFSPRSQKEVGFLFNYGKDGTKILNFCSLLFDQAQVGDGRHHL